MEDADRLAERFETARPRLRRIALRILGSATESDDALQESWLRIRRADVASVANFDGWLTTVVARVCFDALKRRDSRREELTPDDPRRDVAAIAPGERPEEEAMLADSIGTALLILLDALPPAERVAFVLHDTFDVPFDDIAAIVGKSPEAARQLASRARRRVRGASAGRDVATQRHDELVRAFLQASRSGNIPALLALLDPGATLRADAAVMAMGGAEYWQSDRLQDGIKGADGVARTFSGRARAAQPALIEGKPGAVWLDAGEVRVAFCFTIAGDRISAIDLVADRATLTRSIIQRPRKDEELSGRPPTSHERQSGRPWDASYGDGPAPWDIGHPQPAIVRLASVGSFDGAVLDAGCGTGEHALLVASLGLPVLGIDVAQTALALAREKALKRRIDAEFAAADALHLERLRRTFDTVLDCGLFHTFDDEERPRYVASLASVTNHGGMLYVLCFSDAGSNIGPHPVRRDELLAAFARGTGWYVATIEADRIHTRFHDADGAPAWLATLKRL